MKKKISDPTVKSAQVDGFDNYNLDHVWKVLRREYVTHIT